MPRGRKKNYKGGHRHFTDPDEINAREEKEKKEREWRKQRGLLESGDEDEDGDDKDKPKKPAAAAAADSDSGSDSDGYEEAEKDDRHKGVEHLIAVENPNHVAQKMKKVSELDTADDKPQLTRRQKEELQKQQAKERYMKAHLAGKTEEAQADMARLALIRKQREEAAAKRDAEKKAAEDKRKLAEQKLLEKRGGKK